MPASNAVSSSSNTTSIVSDRRRALADVSRDLRVIDGQLDAAGHDQIDDAIEDLDDVATAMDRAADSFVRATGHGLGAAANLGMASAHSVVGTARVGAAATLATGAVAAEVAEDSSDFFGRATQWIGRLFIGAGNEARETADIGGAQLTTVDVAGDEFAPMWSDALRDESGRQMRMAGKHYLESIAHIGGAVANGVMGTAELGRAAGNTLVAAKDTLDAAKDLADAGVIEMAERAVELAGLAVKVVDRAVQYGEEGVDAAGRALQSAGKALVAAGNAVNTARGTDTDVR
jgi:hypothetical protein